MFMAYSHSHDYIIHFSLLSHMPENGENQPSIFNMREWMFPHQLLIAFTFLLLLFFVLNWFMNIYLCAKIQNLSDISKY